MKLGEIANIRLSAQHISNNKFESPKEVVKWLGAMQAQDFNMAKWAIGIRLSGSTVKIIDDAINKGEIFRTHLLRPTWHFVSADDLRWILELTAPHIKASLKSRHKYLGFTQAIINKSFSIIEKSLAGCNHLTREDLMTELKKDKIDVSENRSSHIMLLAELDQIICSGTSKRKKQTYALFDERVPESNSLNREEALTKLAERYFTSHGPATLMDFIWWSGLPISDARKAIEMIKPDFDSEKINGTEYLFDQKINPAPKVKESAYLLPAYDEFIISYKDRSAVLDPKKFDKAISNNGIFRPVIVTNKQVIGIWKPVKSKSKISVETEFFIQPNKVIASLIEKKINELRRFLLNE